MIITMHFEKFGTWSSRADPGAGHGSAPPLPAEEGPGHRTASVLLGLVADAVRSAVAPAALDEARATELILQP
ncbi:hypothetical protein [Streptomyces sp. SP18BB07]|uniref:hypothetical protein n=1 Tax=Streptomyces sp. SP18BB07 TaxID=3002522 RepID=UPI002E75CC2D|nr:hypothetical protein [Streptomyces sp. SP18BB07]MEE1765980.1 hypothetical protein [Streptomyces sp. SP18BB07]